MLGVALGIVVGLSMLAVMLFPEWAMMGWPHTGAWQGVMFHKNALGRIGVLTATILFALIRTDRSFRTTWFVLLIAALAAVIGSRSTTAMVLAVTLPTAYLILTGLARLPSGARDGAALLAIVALIPAALVLPDYVESILNFVGKDLSLTGRIPLWEVLLPIGQDQMWIGYGYGAFWMGPVGPSAEVWARTWDAPHAHSGYMDLWLQTGLIGLGLGVTLLGMTLFRSIRLHMQGVGRIASLFGFLVSAYVLLGDASGTTLLEGGLGKALYWVVTVYAFLIVDKAYRERSLPRGDAA